MLSTLKSTVQQYLSADRTTDMAGCTANGAPRAKRIPRKYSQFRKQPKNIAAIDFGTKNCSLAYITENDRVEFTQSVPKLPLNGMYLRVPTAILLNVQGEVEAFGHDARTLYGNLEDSDRESYFFFEEIKMNLQRDQEVSREMKVKALNGKDFYLVDIIAQILKYLKNEFLIQHLQRGGHQFSVTDFEWVITVPAIWKTRGKQMMREAGYKAGLCSKDCPGYLKVVSGPPLELEPVEKSPDKLSLALEPESAAVYCHEALKRRLIAPYCKYPQEPFQFTDSTPHTYLIVDIGGGTVDISAHRVISLPEPCVEVLHPPIGNDYGGSKVNQEFSKFLETVVCDLAFSRYVETCDPEVNLRNRFELNQLINVSFEEQKQIYGRLEKGRRREASVRLPTSLLEVYQEDLEEGVQTLGTPDVRLVRQNLRLSPGKMEEFFEPAITGILECISDLLEKIATPIDVIYLVGGFGGSPYVYQKVAERYGDQMKCVVPLNPEFAVVEGTVLYRSNPAIIRARKADATYGKSVVRPFQARLHNPKHKHVDDDGIPYCHNLFQTIVEVGETVSPDYVYMCTSVPVFHEQTSMFTEIYSSPEKADYIWYVTGDESRDVTKIGELTVEMPILRGDKSREVVFTFDFSHTEIQVHGYDKASGSEVKTVMDFLSAH